MSKDVIVGNGVIGQSLYTLISSIKEVACVDVDPSKCAGTPNGKIEVLHICFPYSDNFVDLVLGYARKFDFWELVIHSTVKPGTTLEIQDSVDKPVVYSPVRGVHVRMVEDLKRYTKFWSTKDESKVKFYPNELEKCGVKSKFWGLSTQLELAKILLGTTYYGWLILFAQRVKILCDKYGVDEPSIWEFTEEIHEFLGNRPLMFAGDGIGGHCVLQNLEILDDDFIDLAFTHDRIYRRHLREHE